MNKKLLAIISLCLVVMMLVPALVSCKDDPTVDPAVTTTSDPNDESTSPTETQLTSGVPDGVTFDEEEVHWLIWNVTMTEFYVDEVSGNEIEDAIYERNKTVQDKYGVQFIYHEEKGSSGHSEFEKAVEQDFNSDQQYEIIAAYSQTPAQLAMKGYLANLNEFKYLDFDKPWWPETMVEQATINNNLYFCAGDISTNMIWMMTVMFYNKDLALDYQMPNLYELVENYEWTQEKLLELTTDIYTDKNDNGKKDDDDFYGLGICGISLDAFATASGITSVIKDKQTDLFTLNEDFFGERMVNLVDMGIQLLESDGTRYYSDTSSATRVHFGEERALFWADRVFAGAREFQAEGIDVTFGIVPIPMFDTLQKEYFTNIGHPFSLYCISSNVMDEEVMDKTSAILQEMSYLSYQTVTPEVFDTALKNRYADEPDDANMLDLIKNSVKFEMGRFLNQEIGTVATNGYRTTVVKLENTWASSSTKNRRALQIELAALNEKWSKGVQ